MTIKMEEWGMGGTRLVARNDIPAVLLHQRCDYRSGQLEQLQAELDRVRDVLKATLIELSDAQLANIARRMGSTVIDDQSETE